MLEIKQWSYCKYSDNFVQTRCHVFATASVSFFLRVFLFSQHVQSEEGKQG
jgi:hypothetical protein